MILQELVDYYEYLCEHQPDSIVQGGWSQTRIACFINIDEQGNLLSLIPVGEKNGVARIVPEQVKRSSGVSPNFLCDNPAYLLGFDAKGKPGRALRCFDAARERHINLLENANSPAAKAVSLFFLRWNPEEIQDSSIIERNADILQTGKNMAFTVNGYEVLDDPAIKRVWVSSLNSTADDALVGRCLVSGQKTKIARLHPVIKGVAGGQSMGTSLISFNEPAFSSYGHDNEQGFNAPVGEYAAFAYSSALNYLLADRRHHIRLGDTTIVYWASMSDDECTQTVCSFLGGYGTGNDNVSGPDEDPDELINSVMNEIRQGKKVNDVDPGVPFYVLGIAPNAARLSVRFFERNTFGGVMSNLAAHYDRLEIAHAPFERKYLSPYQLLKAVAPPKAKQEPASSVLAGSLMRSILTNSLYPVALYRNALMRIYATQDDKDAHTQKVSYARAAIIKAYLNKNRASKGKEFTVSLDTTRVDVPYVLGRLFAVYEQIQDRANPNLNATIKDRYFNAACTTPGTVFPTLAKLSERHLSKMEKDTSKARTATNLSKELGNLYGRLDCFPKRLSLDEQGAFVLGYQHQHQSYFDRFQTGKENQ